MKIGVLTSSRADYGIYLPLLKKLKFDRRFQLEIIVFGMHLQSGQGNTINEITKDGYKVIHRVGVMPEKDGVIDICKGYGSLIVDFANFWAQNNFDIIFALGDRWGMSAAVQASIPFELKIAHFHGGETTLGATDNIYRHQITLASTYHFTASGALSEKVISLLGSDMNVHTVGSISLESLNELELPDWDYVKRQFDIPFDDFILVTFHSESVAASKNKDYARVVFNTLKEISKQYNILITKANSDVMGSLFNQTYQRLKVLNPKSIKLVATLGKYNYFKAMQQCYFMLGNTSSGIIESASFQKWVINVGDRQKGRLRNENVLDVSFETEKILEALVEVNKRDVYHGVNIYVKPGTTDTIIKLINQHERF